MRLYDDHGEPVELTPEEIKTNEMIQKVQDGAYVLVHEFGWSVKRVHELVERGVNI